MLTILKNYNINENTDTIILLKKSQWKHLIQKRTREEADKINNIVCQTYKKLKHLHVHEKTLNRKKYMETISHQEAVIIFKARTRLLDLRNNF